MITTKYFINIKTHLKCIFWGYETYLFQVGSLFSFFHIYCYTFEQKNQCYIKALAVLQKSHVSESWRINEPKP